MNIYRANYEHASKPFAQGGDIDFQAEDDREAARAFLRWFEARQRHVPEHYQTLLAVKLKRLFPGTIDAEGNLGTAGNWPFFEWKIDCGWTYEQRIERIRP